MKLKSLLVVGLILFTFSKSFSQDYKQNIEKRFNEYYNLIANNKIDEAVEYIPDTFFTIIPKKQMIVALKSVMNNKDLDNKILDYKINQLNDAKLIEKNYYSVISYTSNIKMKFKQIDSIATHEEKKRRLTLLNVALANTFGTDNVTLDEATNFFMIQSHKKSCAISANRLNDWKFVNIEAKQRLMLDKVLPKEIIEAL